jgi:glycerol kinase
MEFVVQQFDLQAFADNTGKIEVQAEARFILDDIQWRSEGRFRWFVTGCVAAAGLVQDILNDVFHLARKILQSGRQLTNLERKRSHSVTPSRFKGLDSGARQSSVNVTAPEFDGKSIDAISVPNLFSACPD